MLATISDRKFGVSSGSSSLIDHYEPLVISAQDYYPFGMLQPGRSYNAGGYRYGFNGKENDNEVKGGVGSQQDYGMRIYDPRVGRFLSEDPLTGRYPELTPYQFASNTPNQATDIDGLEAFYIHGTWSNPNTFSKLTIATVDKITGNTTGATFKWSGYNTDKARQKAAIDLANHIIKNRNPNQPITIVGHSHGGNVAILAANILKKRGVQVENIITINTPVREYQLDQGASKKHINIYQHYDPVQANGGNSTNIPDGTELVPPNGPGGIPTVVPTSHDGTQKGTGEVGPAGRRFENAINIPVDFDKEHIHDSHNTPTLWEKALNAAIHPTPVPPYSLEIPKQKQVKDQTTVTPHQ